MSALAVVLHADRNCIGIALGAWVYTHNNTFSWPRAGWSVVAEDQIPERFANGKRIAGFLARARIRASEGAR